MGPRIDPWGTPDVWEAKGETDSLRPMQEFLSDGPVPV